MASVCIFHLILEPTCSTDLCTSVKCYCFDSVDNVPDRMCHNLSMGFFDYCQFTVYTVYINKAY